LTLNQIQGIIDSEPVTAGRAAEFIFHSQLLMQKQELARKAVGQIPASIEQARVGRDSR